MFHSSDYYAINLLIWLFFRDLTAAIPLYLSRHRCKFLFAQTLPKQDRIQFLHSLIRSLIYRIVWEARKQKWWLTYSNIVHPDPKDSPSPRRRCGSPTYIFSPRNARATWRRCSSPGWASSRSWWWRQRRTKRKRRRRRTRRIQSRRCDPRNPSGRRIASRPECIWSHRIGTHWCILCTTRSPRNVVTSIVFFFFFFLPTQCTLASFLYFISLFSFISIPFFFFFICFLSIFCSKFSNCSTNARKKKEKNREWQMGFDSGSIVNPLCYYCSFRSFSTHFCLVIINTRMLILNQALRGILISYE